MTSTVVIVIVAVLVLLFELQYPFRSAIRIQPTAWQAALDHIHLMEGGDQAHMRM
jgi:hypothetical protein